MMENAVSSIKKMAERMREHALTMAFSAGANGAHLGGGLSMIEIMATLYGGVLRLDPKNPDWEDRDRFIPSKGHGVLAYYTALAEAGFFPVEDLKKFEMNGEFLPGHPVMNVKKGIECSSGSLGMGLSFGVGIALAGKTRTKSYHTYVLLGDGECNEGAVWEAAMSASQFHLSNLIAIVDRNDLQYDGCCSEIMNMDPMKAKWESFGWDAVEVDGHDVQALYEAFQSCTDSSEPKPHVVIAHTIKGKGVSFMENKKEWHHSSLSQKQYETAVAELRSGN
ncbi:MAG: transketolase [Methanoregula sp.]|uniref:transketolase n=2 Tax=Methanoregula sp. TaxID=2052170 RepID=UPI003BE8AEFA